MTVGDSFDKMATNREAEWGTGLSSEGCRRPPTAVDRAQTHPPARVAARLQGAMAPAAAEAPPAAAAPESGADVLEALANLLRARSNANPARRDEPLPSSSINYFMASRAADISVEDYLRRLLRFFECSQSCLVLVAIYVDRVLSLREETSR
ncbi:unnamed protein product [Prorocentrum cordatum]|uniref:Cyclin n=1 Tax=Prorocentrum cordatum TaxID=2364126 RepID=A0ABN9TTP9_9DINO|nr:unnamed protein product [Polarella glacialis]